MVTFQRYALSCWNGVDSAMCWVDSKQPFPSSGACSNTALPLQLIIATLQLPAPHDAARYLEIQLHKQVNIRWCQKGIRHVFEKFT
jgi:hypothetical protein